MNNEATLKCISYVPYYNFTIGRHYTLFLGSGGILVDDDYETKYGYIMDDHAIVAMFEMLNIHRYFVVL